MVGRSACLLVIGGLSACAGDSAGLIVADIHPAAEATIVRTRAFGGLLWSRPNDAGLGVGFKERIYVFENKAFTEAPVPGRAYFVTSLPKSAPLFLMDTIYGAEFTINSLGLGWTLGARQVAFTTPVRPDASLVRNIAVDLADLARSSVTIRHFSTDGGGEP
jgi:hypothetical protein